MGEFDQIRTIFGAIARARIRKAAVTSPNLHYTRFISFSPKKCQFRDASVLSPRFPRFREGFVALRLCLRLVTVVNTTSN